MPVPRISKEDLKQRLEAPETAPVLVDVRLKYPYEHSSVKLPGALRFTADDAAAATLPKDRDIVVYDSDPSEVVSAPVVAALVARGYRAMALQGGFGAWMGASLPTEPRVPPAGTAAPDPGAGASA
jgi:rhodanese-related sulfurtransferase